MTAGRAMPGEPVIGVFGGTFDPVHLGHLTVAEEVRQALEIGDFRMMPAGSPPHREKTHAPARHRLAMLRLALDGHPDLKVDTRELDRSGPSWMVDTLGSLRAEYPKTPLILVLGQDSANTLDSWHRWREIPALAHIAIMTRPDEVESWSPELRAELEPRLIDDHRSLRAESAGRVLQVQVSRVDVSSTEVRRLIRAQRDPAGMIPQAVLNYIREHGLYGCTRPACECGLG